MGLSEGYSNISKSETEITVCSPGDTDSTEGN